MLPLLAIEDSAGETNPEEEKAGEEDQLEENTALTEVEDHIFEHLPPKLHQGMIFHLKEKQYYSSVQSSVSSLNKYCFFKKGGYTVRDNTDQHYTVYIQTW